MVGNGWFQPLKGLKQNVESKCLYIRSCIRLRTCNNLSLTSIMCLDIIAKIQVSSSNRKTQMHKSMMSHTITKE